MVNNTDGTLNYQSTSYGVIYSSVNKAGVYTSVITSQPDNAVTAVSSGTLANAFTITAGTNLINILINANTTLSTGTTTITTYFSVIDYTGKLITLV